MENKIVKTFLDDFKQYIIDMGKEVGTANSYRANVKRACKIADLGEGFIEAIAVITDIETKAALCEFLRAKLSEIIETSTSKVPDKSIKDCRSAVSALAEFVTKEENSTFIKSAETSFLPSIALPCESVYTQQDMIRIFKQRLATQDRYYASSCLPARIITKINAQSIKKDIYKNLILHTRFLYDTDPNKHFQLSEITKLTIKTDGLVKIQVKGAEYDVYTGVYSKGHLVGYERIRVDSFALLSLDHILPVHRQLQEFVKKHIVYSQFSKSIIDYKASCPEMPIAQFSTEYFQKVYPELAINENTLINEVCQFIDSLNLVILHRSFNSSKSDK